MYIIIKVATLSSLMRANELHGEIQELLAGLWLSLSGHSVPVLSKAISQSSIESPILTRERETKKCQVKRNAQLVDGGIDINKHPLRRQHHS
jgi:hypothetical protein